MPELWDAYNSRMERMEGETLVRGEPVPEGRFHLVCDVVVRHTDGTYLLMQRKPGIRLGGKWELTAGGSVIQGETAAEGAVRELREETGLAAPTLIPLACMVSEEKRTLYAEYLCITDCPKDAVVLQPEETSAYRWVEKAELLSMNEDDLASVRALGFVRDGKA